jgi:hypothetical protein
MTTGCGPRVVTLPATRHIIAGGTIERLTVWEKPVIRAGELGQNIGHSTYGCNRVEVYDQFILVTPSGGPTILVPNGSYTDLAFRRDSDD